MTRDELIEAVADAHGGAGYTRPIVVAITKLVLRVVHDAGLAIVPVVPTELMETAAAYARISDVAHTNLWMRIRAAIAAGRLDIDTAPPSAGRE